MVVRAAGVLSTPNPSAVPMALSPPAPSLVPLCGHGDALRTGPARNGGLDGEARHTMQCSVVGWAAVVRARERAAAAAFSRSEGDGGMSDEREYLTLREAAVCLGISEPALRRRVLRGLPTYTNPADLRSRLIKAADLERYAVPELVTPATREHGRGGDAIDAA